MNLYSQIEKNKRNSILLIISLIGLVGALGYVFAYINGTEPGPLVVMSAGGAIIYALISYFFSDKMVLALSGAQKIEHKSDHYELFTLVENVCIGAGLPMPEIYIIEDPAPNAFATGRDPAHASVCFTTGILARLERSELEGVVAHELAHIKNYDIRFTTLVVVIVGAIALLSDIFLRMTILGGGRRNNKSGGGIIAVIGIIFIILAPIFGTIIKFAISRQREYLADASAVYITRNPEGLARALLKISQSPEELKSATSATESLYIVNPFKSKSSQWLKGIFSTHPPIEERVKRLRQM